MTASYLYCIVNAARKPSLAKVPAGLPGAAPPEAVKVTPTLWLIAADVPLDTYGAAPLERALADMDWVGRVALAHEAVVEHFAARRGLTVIPMKLFTMFSSQARAVADVSSRKAVLSRAMRRLAGAEEWGVRVLRGGGAAAAPASIPRSGGGAAFLAEKKQARDEARSARLAAAEAAGQAFDRLARVSRDARRRDDAPAEGATPPLLDAAFLVPVSRRAAFTRAARREADSCARAGAQMTLSGPWPAYNFVAGEGLAS